ncbi:ATP-dependent helicase [Luteibacter aegosomatissinici]|nr:ATP-dependent helicase [Luteibacter aegosomatissinici]UPG96586.1 ATP-dependent helicase [Luteibacter aegosomatissinici]
MRLTGEQRAAVARTGNVYVEACPGSGKTRVLTARLIEACQSDRWLPRRVACITFTNTAVDEIQQRLTTALPEQREDRVAVCTIHSFCLAYIFRPFHQRLEGYQHGYTFVTPDDERAIALVQQITQGLGANALSAIELDTFATASMTAAGEPVLSGRAGPLAQVMPLYWNACRARGWLDYNLLLQESAQILARIPEAVQSLSAKFHTVLVDEFQDTTHTQLTILTRLFQQASSQFFLVGDPHQSIYQFTGAEAARSEGFIAQVCGENRLSLTGNFRSSDEIVGMAERMLPRQPRMRARPPAARRGVSAEVYTTQDCASAVVDHFVPTAEAAHLGLGDCAVLAAWWTDLLPIARLCWQRGIPVIGPGARPYRRGRLIVGLMENLAASATNVMALELTVRAMRRTLDDLGVSRASGLDGWEGRVLGLQLQAAAKAHAAADDDGIAWIRRVAQIADQLFHDAGYPVGNVFSNSAEEVIADIHARQSGHPAPKVTVDSLGLFARPDQALRLMTVHAAKGREFDGVAIVRANESRFPHFTASSAAEIEEGRRVLYVAMTRAKRLLHLYVDSSLRNNGPSRFLARL